MKEINGNTLKLMIQNAAAWVMNRRESIDELNVFPVPDGDTGTNMSMTLSATAKDLLNRESTRADEVMEYVAASSLRGARGNSGVILSQFFRGMSRGLKGKGSANTKDFAAALLSGSETVYKAVMKPTEGTMLTVARESAQAAMLFAPGCADFEQFFTRLLEKAQSVLANTPNLLPVLKQAGVVDAGGTGLVAIYEAFLMTVTGAQIPKQQRMSAPNAEKPGAEKPIDSADIKHIYCTEFLINKISKNASVLPFESAISPDSDSMMVVEDGDIIKVHIHTNNPGLVLQHALKLGELSSIKIDNMKQQHNEILEIPSQPAEIKQYGFVAVASGSGLAKVFADLGVDKVVDGGQSANPSTDDILRAVNSVNARHVFVLPCNKNIIAAAKQTIGLTHKSVHVINCVSVPQGISAMIEFDADGQPYENIEAMNMALTRVKSGLVTRAVRNSIFGKIKISKGDVLGINEGAITKAGASMRAVMLDLIKEMVAGIKGDCAVITLFYGEHVSQAFAEELQSQLMAFYPDADILITDGSQPVYDFIISVE